MANTERHVAQFLNMIDLEGRVVDLALRFLRPRRGRTGSSKVVSAVERWYVVQARKRYGEAFDLRKPNERVIADARDAAAVLHLSISRSHRPARKPSADDPAQMTRLLEALEPDFPENMLAELRLREGRSPTFARELGRARAWVAGAAQSLQQSLKEREVEDVGDVVDPDGEESLSVILKDNNAAGIGILVVVVLLACIAVWYFDQVNQQKSDDSDDNDE